MLKIQGKQILFNGEPTQILGRSSFKFVGALVGNNISGAKNWIEHNQNLGINLLRVFGETRFWKDHPMFGSPPRIDDIWDWGALANGHRPNHVTTNNREVLRTLFDLSESTGMAFEYVIDATIKHSSPPTPWGTIGHCIRQTLSECRSLQERYPKALIIINFHNEWNAHSDGSWRRDYGNVPDRQTLALKELNRQAQRARRWVKQGSGTVVSFTSPGSGWEPEQWPGAAIMVDPGGSDTITYNVGTGPNEFPIVALHPSRSAEWSSINSRAFLQYLNGPVPVYFSESKMYVDPASVSRASNWYRPASFTTDTNIYRKWMDGCRDLGIHFTIHDEKGMQADSGWPIPMTPLEESLRGAAPEPPPPSDLVWKTVYEDQDTRLQRRADTEGEPPPPPPDPIPQPPPKIEYLPKWDDVKDLQWGRVPHAQASYRSALHSIRQELVWNGVRNAQWLAGQPAEKFPYHNGHSNTRTIENAQHAAHIAERSEELLDLLIHFVDLDPSVAHGAKVLGGTWPEGRTRRTRFERWYKDFSSHYVWVRSVDGIQS